jgi:tetratricopeptide (TPR) repeat protein
MTPLGRRALVGGIPFLVSAGLSAATVGAHATWQDSGFYLVAVKEMSVLYPPGFVLYQLLCRAWTGLLFFVDFTLAVHLFSSLSAALASGTVAYAARSLLRARGPLLDPGTGRDEDLSDWAAAGAGCLAASGYTWWCTGLYAKGYSLYYLILALLLFFMIRAAEGGKPRAWTAVALLIGLAWAGHPSSALLGPALAGFVLAHARQIGARGVAWRACLSGAVALAPTALLPFLAGRAPLFAMGDPSDPGELGAYLLGTNFTGIPGAFGWDSGRVAWLGRCFLEEFLGVGVAAVAVGLLAIGRSNRRLLWGLGAWMIPAWAGTIAFKVEGQLDCWAVAGWLPLYPVAAVGLSDLAGRLTRHRRAFVAGLTAAAVAWAGAVNGPILEARTYDLAEIYGRLHLEPLDPGSILLLSGDDALALTSYLQAVRAVRTDIAVVNLSRLGATNSRHGRWYVARLLSAYPFLRAPDLPEEPARVESNRVLQERVTAFVNANFECGRPLFSSVAPSARGLREEVSAVPAGPLWKVVRRGTGTIDPRYWEAPLGPEEVRGRFRRARGQEVRYESGTVEVLPEPYEQRLLRLLLRARLHLAMTQVQFGNFPKALELYQEAERLDPHLRQDPGFLTSLGRAAYGLKDRRRAQECFQDVLRRGSDPLQIVEAHRYLGRIAREEGRKDDARLEYRQALDMPGIEPRLRREIEEESARP